MTGESETLKKIEAAVRALAREDGPAGHAVARAAPETAALEHRRLLEAILFAAAEPLDTETLRARLPRDADVSALLAELSEVYAGRGVNLVRVAEKWRLQTAPDLAPYLVQERKEPKKLSQAALETLSIVAYHQPVTRAEIEEVRGVAVSKGSLDQLFEIGWVKPRGRRRTPGRPLTYATTEAFLVHFGLESLEDLPGKDELKAAGLLDARLPPDFDVPDPSRSLGEGEGGPLDGEADFAADGAFHTDFLEDEDGA